MTNQQRLSFTLRLRETPSQASGTHFRARAQDSTQNKTTKASSKELGGRSGGMHSAYVYILICRLIRNFKIHGRPDCDFEGRGSSMYTVCSPRDTAGRDESLRRAGTRSNSAVPYCIEIGSIPSSLRLVVAHDLHL